jgi:hypothetical protein
MKIIIQKILRIKVPLFLIALFAISGFFLNVGQVEASAFFCAPHVYQQCIGNNVYWYDSCGNQQELYQYCQNGCYNNSCSGGYNNCNYHAYRLCVGNNIYWFDSCGTQQELYQSCFGTNQTCQYGLCIYVPPAPAPNPYIAHYSKACYSENVYWYDSLSQINSLYKSCEDSNSCTQDICVAKDCSNTLKCDGTTCAVGTPDYNTHCATSNCGNGLCEPNLGETSATCLSDCKINVNTLTVSFFTKVDANSNQWQKQAQIGQNGQIYFMVSVGNNGSVQLDNVNLSVNIPSEVSSLGNVQINGVPSQGDITYGIDIGSLLPSNAKSITFEGRTQLFSSRLTKPATATVGSSGSTQSDSVSIDLNPGEVAGVSISLDSESTGWDSFWSFLKRWYLWILVAFVLIFLFFVVFKRLSSNNA